MPEQIRTYTVKKVSDELEVSADTVRRYTKEFSQFLSEDAQPTGETRLFNDRDLYYLRSAARYLKSGHTYEQTREHLENVPEPQDAGQITIEEARTPDIIASAALQELTAALYAIADASQRTDRLEGRLDAVQDTGHNIETELAEIRRQNEQLQRQQEQLNRVTARPVFWAIVGAFVSALVILAAVAVALANGWLG